MSALVSVLAHVLQTGFGGCYRRGPSFPPRIIRQTAFRFPECDDEGRTGAIRVTDLPVAPAGSPIGASPRPSDSAGRPLLRHARPRHETGMSLLDPYRPTYRFSEVHACDVAADPAAIVRRVVAYRPATDRAVRFTVGLRARATRKPGRRVRRDRPSIPGQVIAVRSS
jgi:hypothetical protein